MATDHLRWWSMVDGALVEEDGYTHMDCVSAYGLPIN